MIILWLGAGIGLAVAGAGIGYYFMAKGEAFDMLSAKNKEMDDVPCGVQKLAQIILAHLSDSEQDLREALEDFIKTLAKRRR